MNKQSFKKVRIDAKHRDIICEALLDYRRWFCGPDEMAGDADTRRAIDHALASLGYSEKPLPF